jgi:hypothetical protein
LISWFATGDGKPWNFLGKIKPDDWLGSMAKRFKRLHSRRYLKEFVQAMPYMLSAYRSP